MSNFHNWVIDNEQVIKQNIISVVEKQSIMVSFMGYYLEDNDKSYSMEPRPVYDTIPEYLEDNPNHGTITHIRYFFALKKGDETHTMTAHIYDRDKTGFLFSIEELAVEGTIMDLAKTKGFEIIKPMLMKKFTPYLDSIENLHKKIIDHGKIGDDTLNKINYKLRLDWNYYSNRMEGGTLTKPETRQVMLGVSVGAKPLNDVKEMSGHDKAVQEILHVAQGSLRIAESRIKNMHKLIMSEDDEKKEALIGVWKEENNEVINHKGEKQVFLSYEEVPLRIHELIDKTNAELDAHFNSKKQSRHPLYIAADFHLKYLYIHPFYDGNGRTARLLTNLILISCGYPPIIITDRTKEVYYRLISEVQSYGADKELFYAFMGERLQETQRLILDALDGKDISEDDDFDKEIALLKNELNTKEDEVIIGYDDLNLVDFLEDNALPLLLNLCEKGKKLEELFKKNQISIHIGQKWETTTFNNAHALFNKLLHQIEPKNTYDFKIDISLVDFIKNGINSFNVVWKCTLDFGRVGYTIKFDYEGDSMKWVKLYHKNISAEEHKEIVDSFGNHCLTEIRRRVKN
ncbi:Fic family protein [Maribacter flavus]|uniref:Fic family protein n=1 Tax=Maribacter flavus TaxID=1658664 RepID=A0A5B2TNF7_9FLAO|nr:Fic family protein [Maribacter flavus]KAA2215744.1 Fic family protein [Maribacter flavus]